MGKHHADQLWNNVTPIDSSGPYSVMDYEAQDGREDDYARICANCRTSKGQHHYQTFQCPIFSEPGNEDSTLFGFRGHECFTPASAPLILEPLVDQVRSGISSCATEGRLEELRVLEPETVMTVTVKGPNAAGDYLVCVMNPERSLADEVVCHANRPDQALNEVEMALRDGFSEWLMNHREDGPTLLCW